MADNSINEAMLAAQEQSALGIAAITGVKALFIAQGWSEINAEQATIALILKG